jgi:glutamate-1-semialdehyde 2,1-aminomutase
VNATQTLPSDEPRKRRYERSRALRERAHALIPGGSHTYAKGDDQYPEEAPAFIERGAGCRVWDLDGNEFIEYGMGLRAVALGHGHPGVVAAAHREMLRGTNFVRPSPIEVECAEEFLGLIEGAEMVKFAKNGSDVTTAALRLARAHTGRDLVAYCADQPFFSVDDWFIGATATAAGIPAAVRNLTLSFRYNDLDSVRHLFARHPGQIACLILEAATIVEPEAGFLPEVARLCAAEGALFILDEMITGFRWHLNGAQRCYGVIPDLSTFGKALANGFAVSALAGKREIMERGGLHHAQERVFLLSTTHGAETHALAAAIETMRIYQREPVIEVIYRQGERLRAGVERAIREERLEGYFEVLGRPCNLIYATRDEQGERSQAFRTLFLQEILKRGVIAPSFIVSYAHDDRAIDQTIEAVAEALAIYRRALDEGVDKYLVGRPVKPVFRRFN